MGENLRCGVPGSGPAPGLPLRHARCAFAPGRSQVGFRGLPDRALVWLAILRVQVSAGLANRRGQRVDSLVELIVLDQNRGQEPDDGSPRGQDEDASLLHGLDHGRNWLLELDGLHHAPAADLANLRQSKVSNALLKTGPGVGRACMERFVSEHLEGRGPGGADQWIAGEGAPMASLGHSLADRLRRNGHADWQAVGDRLREAHDVGDDVLTGEGKWAPGPKPGLDLVTYKKDR